MTDCCTFYSEHEKLSDVKFPDNIEEMNLSYNAKWLHNTFSCKVSYNQIKLQYSFKTLFSIFLSYCADGLFVRLLLQLIQLQGPSRSQLMYLSLV